MLVYDSGWLGQEESIVILELQAFIAPSSKLYPVGLGYLRYR